MKAALGIWEALLRAPEITSAWWLQASLTTELKWDWSLLQQAVTLGASRWFMLPLLMSWVNLPGRLMHPVIGIKALTFSVNGTSFSDIFEYKQMEITVKP